MIQQTFCRYIMINFIKADQFKFALYYVDM